ncbi:MAG TPA: VWA domain-containing protein [Candidatus Acidoferrales bacterium]
MTRRVSIALLLAALLVPMMPGRAQNPPPGKGSQEQVIRTGADLVNIIFSVLNRREEFVKDLEKGDFRVTEDGKEQRIEFFSRETDLPLRIGLLLDTSNSIRDRLKFEQEAATDFVHQVVRRRKDQAFLMIFDNRPVVIQDFTDDLNDLTETIRRQRAGGGTALYDAVYDACRDRLTNPPLPEEENKQVRRVLVVISDGMDNLSDRTRSQAIEMAQRAEVVIYTISTSTDWMSITGAKPQKYHKTEGDKVLEQMAEQTGGRAFFPYRIDDLARSFQDISVELRSQYSLGYTPSNRTFDGRFRQIKIEVDRRGLLVRARKGYFATRREAQTPADPGQ